MIEHTIEHAIEEAFEDGMGVVEDAGLEITGCPRHRDFEPGTEIFEARCPAGTGQKRSSSSPVIQC